MTNAVGYLPTIRQLANLFEEQEKLDKHILNTHFPLGADEDLLELKIYALITEIAEAMNEYRAFKFWSTDREPRTEKLLGELVDVLHFMISISQGVGSKLPEIFMLEGHDRPLRSFGDLFSRAHKLMILKENDFVIYKRDIGYLFASYFELIFLLGFTWEDIEQAYHRKNEENHTRQETAY